jgi:hypothetical protein
MNVYTHGSSHIYSRRDLQKQKSHIRNGYLIPKKLSTEQDQLTCTRSKAWCIDL